MEAAGRVRAEVMLILSFWENVEWICGGEEVEREGGVGVGW